MWFLIMNYYPTIKRNEILIHENIMLCKRSQSQKAHTVSFHTCEISRISKSIETEDELVVATGWGRGENREWLLNRYRVSFSEMKMFGTTQR